MGLDRPAQVIRKTSIANSINYRIHGNIRSSLILIDFSFFHRKNNRIGISSDKILSLSAQDYYTNSSFFIFFYEKNSIE